MKPYKTSVNRGSTCPHANDAETKGFQQENKILATAIDKPACHVVPNGLLKQTREGKPTKQCAYVLEFQPLYFL